MVSVKAAGDVVGVAAAANEKLTVNDYDLLLLDLTLPDGDGFTICRTVRSGEMQVSRVENDFLVRV